MGHAVQWNYWYLLGERSFAPGRPPTILWTNQLWNMDRDNQKRLLKVHSGEKLLIKNTLQITNFHLEESCQWSSFCFIKHVFRCMTSNRMGVASFCVLQTSMAFCKPLVRPRNSSMAHLRWGHLVLFWLALTKSYTPENQRLDTQNDALAKGNSDEKMAISFGIYLCSIDFCGVKV